MAINTSTLFNLIKNEKGTNIKKIERTGRWPIGKNSSKIAQVIVRAIDRFDAVDHIIDVLEGNGLKWQETTAGASTFTQLEVKGNNVSYNPSKSVTGGNYESQGGNEVKFRILFKFPDGTDVKDYDIFNEALIHLFKNGYKKYDKVPSHRTELPILKKINKFLEKSMSSSDGVTLFVNGTTYKKVVGLVGGSGHQDFRAVTSDGKVAFTVSYKDGFNSKSFQQYSGITDRSHIGSNDEVQNFRESVVDNWSSYKSDGFTAMSRPIQKKQLKIDAVFGDATYFCQGKPNLKDMGNDRVQLKFNTQTTKNIDDLNNGYTPTLGARGGEGNRRVTHGGKSVNGVRGGVFTKDYIKDGRKAKGV
tara:strand:- start:1635 stop:2714 length:1080 start_codon:yes stop_codon:yes gene_type:complete